jgi:DNA-binding response OmpR family regulator
MSTEPNLSSSSQPDGAPSPGLILIDDDPLITDSLAFVLTDDFDVRVAESRPEAKALLQGLEPVPALALVDLGLPPTPQLPDEGFALIGELLAFNPSMKILVLSAQSERANIQHALTLGAVDFIPKPCDVTLLKARLQHQLMILEAETEAAARPVAECGLLGASPAMETLRAQIRQFADTPFPVLVEGESGSGKELVAQCLHSQSQRSRAPFLTINCAAISGDLLEAQLFGHAKGAFTGAMVANAGFFEEAADGTLFLDEIGEFPVPLQPKLLRVLENGEYYRVGETRPRKANARIIAATNRDLREEVRARRFREDLYHRLGVLSITVPPRPLRGHRRPIQPGTGSRTEAAHLRVPGERAGASQHCDPTGGQESGPADRRGRSGAGAGAGVCRGGEQRHYPGRRCTPRDPAGRIPAGRDRARMGEPVHQGGAQDRRGEPQPRGPPAGDEPDHPVQQDAATERRRADVLRE